VPEIEDDGMLALDYLDDLNMTEGNQRTEEIAELNFSEIDEDLVSAFAYQITQSALYACHFIPFRRQSFLKTLSFATRFLAVSTSASTRGRYEDAA
jgi:hypothetical protein